MSFYEHPSIFQVSPHLSIHVYILWISSALQLKMFKNKDMLLANHHHSQYNIFHLQSQQRTAQNHLNLLCLWKYSQMTMKFNSEVIPLLSEATMQLLSSFHSTFLEQVNCNQLKYLVETWTFCSDPDSAWQFVLLFRKYPHCFLWALEILCYLQIHKVCIFAPLGFDSNFLKPPRSQRLRMHLQYEVKLS